MFNKCLSYVVAFMVVLQSFTAVADIHPDAPNNSEHFELHQHVVVITEQADEPLFSAQVIINDSENNENHSECHHGHCHHGSVVFIVKHQQGNAFSNKSFDVNVAANHFTSMLITPDLRPPIFLIS